jgi:SpoVK/Ycf46/Vps4 family AAA+-type ATPase
MPNGPYEILLVVTNQTEVFDVALPESPGLLKNGGRVVASVARKQSCQKCWGLSAFELNRALYPYAATIQVDIVRQRATCRLDSNMVLRTQWCDRCGCSGQEPGVPLEIQVSVPPGTSELAPLLISNVAGPDGLVLGDLSITFEARRDLNATKESRSRANGKMQRVFVNPSLDGVALPDDVRQRLMRAVAMFVANDPAMPRGLLLTGPPGTGKTLLAKRIAAAVKGEFIAVSLPDLKGAHVGQSASQVRAVWEKAYDAERAVIFVDECEGAFARRGSEKSDSLTDELVQSFLAAWDGFSSKKTVWVIGATNRPDLIDDAIISRFGETLRLGLPGPEARAAILRHEFDVMLVPLQVDAALVDATDGLSGRDLSKLAQAVRQETFPDAPTPEALEIVLKRLRKRTSTTVDASATWDSLVLDEAVMRRLQGIVRMLKDSQNLRVQGVSSPSTLLLEGPPGTGKTQIARTMANESGLRFIGCTTADLKAGYLGQSGQRVRELFERARANAPCLLFIDEIDAISTNRGEADALQGEMIGQLLQELDGINEDPSPPFVMAATNRLADIDESIRSRFANSTVTVPLPNENQRSRILAIRLASIPCDFVKADMANVLAAHLEGVSGRDLKNLVAQAAQNAATRAYEAGDGSAIVVQQGDFDEIVGRRRRERSTTVDSGATWDRLILSEDMIDNLRTACEMLKNAADLERDGIAIPSALLLEGPPGTGKTQIARTLANESGLSFIGITTADVKAGYLGQSGQRIKALFHEARSQAPCIVFLDELDSIAATRRSEDDIIKEMVDQLLQEMDGVKASSSHVFIIGATNRAEDIDQAVLSRFSWQERVDLPDADQREKLLNVLIGNVPIAVERSSLCHELSPRLAGASGRDLKSIVEVAERMAMRRALSPNGNRKPVLEMADFEAAISAARFARV